MDVIESGLQYEFISGVNENQIVGAGIDFGIPPVYPIPLTNGAFPFGMGNLVVSSNTPDGVLHDSEVYSSLRLRVAEKTFNIASGDVSEVPTSGPTYFWKAFPYDRMLVPIFESNKELKVKYRDNPYKHPSLQSVYQVTLLIEYVEHCPELEQITDPAVREKIYKEFAESSEVVREIDLTPYLSATWNPKLPILSLSAVPNIEA